MASKKKKHNNFFKKYLLVLILFCLIIYFFRNHYVNRDSIVQIKGPERIYLALNESKALTLDIEKKSNGIDSLNYESDNENIVLVNGNGILTAKELGSAIINVNSVSGVSKSIRIIVTDLITVPTYAQEKNELPCKKYSIDEAELFDDILKTDVDNALYGTRAGVVAAARFIALRFPYKINYFYENGRLSGSDRAYIDGEGRYYHKGLYLDEGKFDLLETNASTTQPVIWGCDLYANYVKTYSRNGLNCSGFISWAMLNGGFDIGDIGAGITDQFDFTDIGEKVDITSELLTSEKIKVGDLIGRNGHIAIIIGIDSNKIYIAESYMPSMKVREFTFDELINNEDFKYIILMDSIYKDDGNLTNMW